MSRSSRASFSLSSVALLLSLEACGHDGGTTSSSSGVGAGTASSSASSTSSSTGSGTSSGTGGSTPVDPCATALLCEKFESYPTVTALTDGQQFGPWRAALSASGGVMNLDSAHTTSGSHALHMHLDTGANPGGRLFAEGNEPIFAGNPTHLYGRMMMYIDPNGPSIHWTFFGASGNAEPSSPVTGRRATYLMSSLPKNDVNTYSFVYGLEAQGSDPYHDCYFQGPASMPTAQWTCVSFEMDSVTRQLKMSQNGASPPTVAVDDHGQGCVGNVPGTGPWYGPAIDQLYVGAWSFHPMVSPLDVWIDDLIVDTKPVDCPPP